MRQISDEIVAGKPAQEERGSTMNVKVSERYHDILYEENIGVMRDSKEIPQGALTPQHFFFFLQE